jgi:hypothetical protein
VGVADGNHCARVAGNAAGDVAGGCRFFGAPRCLPRSAEVRAAVAAQLRGVGVHVQTPVGPVPLWAGARERGSYETTWGAA